MLNGLRFDILFAQHYCYGPTTFKRQKWAGGHRCSLRHNVCRPATDSCTCLYNYVNIYTSSVASGHIPTHKFIHRTEILDFVVR